MTTQYTPTLKLALPVTGELSGTWGDVVNDNITSMIEQAIAGLVTINTWTGNAHTLTTANGTTSESRCAMLVAATGGGAPTAAAEIICPAAAKLYVLQNNTSYAVTLKTSAGTGVAVAAGNTAFLFCDGTNVNSCVTTIVDGNITGNLTVGGNATINGNTTLGNATSDTITATARFNTDLLPSTDNARDLGSAANAWKDLFIDGTATMALVAISGGTINGVSIGATTAATLINVDNLRLDGNTISSTDTNGNVVIAPNGTGDVQLDADTVRVGDAAAAVTLTSNGAGALTVTTGGAADLTLSTNSGTTSGTVVIANGVNGNITLTPDGTGDVILSADRVQIGDSNTDTTLTTNGTGSLNLTTNNGSNSGTIQIAQGVNGNITLTPNGTGSVSVPKLVWSNGTATRVPYLTTGGQFTDSANLTFNGTDLTVSGAVNAGSIAATTLDLTNLEVTNIKAKDGTAAMTIADSTGAVSFANNVTLGDATTDTVTVNGYMGVGQGAVSTTAIVVGSTALTGTTQRGVYSAPTFNSSATTAGIAMQAWPATAAASFTLSDAVGFWANNAAKGAGSTITNQHGLYIQDQTQGTNNYGITSLVSSGSNKWNIYASGTAQNYFAGSVGLGVTVPSTKLAVAGDISMGVGLSSSQLLFSGSSYGQVVASGGTYYLDATTQIYRNSAGTTEYSRYTSAGNLLIGTTSVAVNQGVGLTLGSSTGATLSLSTNLAAGTTASPINMDLSFRGYNNYEMARIRSWDESGSTGFGYLTFATNNGSNVTTEAMRINNGQEVMIGTNVTGSKLKVSSGSTTKPSLWLASGTSSWQSAPVVVSDAGAGLYATNIYMAGDVGATQKAWRFGPIYNSAGGNNFTLGYSTADQAYGSSPVSLTYTTYAVMNSAGQFTVGNSAPYGAEKVSIYSTGTGLTVWGNVSDGGTIKIGGVAAYQGSISYTGVDSTTLYLDNSYDVAAASVRVRVRTSGTPVTPGYFNAYGMGLGVAPSSGTGIAFPSTQSASSNANTLDDYEEGDWTPSINLLGTVTYSGQSGKYTKVGRLVTVQFSVVMSSTDTTQDSSAMLLSGFPFACGYSTTEKVLTERVYGTYSTGGVTFNVFLGSGSSTATIQNEIYNGPIASASYYTSLTRAGYKGGSMIFTGTFSYTV